MKRHYTFSYVTSRIKQTIFQSKNPNAPWLTPESISLLNQLIKKSDVGFEFGSGRSTKWFATRCQYLFSVEHNPKWFDIVQSQIKDYENVEYAYKTINEDMPFESDYLSKIKQIENESIDFVLNDGKIRGSVANASIDKLKSGGLYIIDNAERYISNNFKIPESIGDDLLKMSKEWIEFTTKTRDWRKIWTTDGVSSTLILFKA